MEHVLPFVIMTITRQVVIFCVHYSDVTWVLRFFNSQTICSTSSDCRQRKGHSSTLPVLYEGIHRLPINFPSKEPVMRKAVHSVSFQSSDIVPSRFYSMHTLILLYVQFYPQYLGQVTKVCGSLVPWFYYYLIANPGNMTVAPSWPDPFAIDKNLN